MNTVPQEIAVVTGGRADFGLLANVCRLLEDSDQANLTVIATGSHLSKKHGYTLDEVQANGFSNVQTVDLEIDGDSADNVNQYISKAVSKFSRLFSQTKFDKILVLGDRYEIFGASIAASILGKKLAHIHGGEVTEGAFDEFIRHSITKMSVLHFTTHADYSKRVMQLGEDPSSIFTVGGLGAENIELMKPSLLSRDECERTLGVRFKNKNLFVTFHPETNHEGNTLSDLETLLEVLSTLKDTSIILSLPNADTNFDAFIGRISEFVEKDKTSRWAFASMAQLQYFSLLKHVDAVVGNSSSGLLEAPSFQVATINIGDRQKGRIRSSSVLDVPARTEDISNAIEKVYSSEFSEVLGSSSNPYYKQDTAKNIVNTLLNRSLSDDPKAFFDYR